MVALVVAQAEALRSLAVRAVRATLAGIRIGRDQPNWPLVAEAALVPSGVMEPVLVLMARQGRAATARQTTTAPAAGLPTQAVVVGLPQTGRRRTSVPTCPPPAVAAAVALERLASLPQAGRTAPQEVRTWAAVAAGAAALRAALAGRALSSSDS